MAYLKHCRSQTTHKRDKSMDRSGETKELFVEHLGVWLQADPLGGERAMQTIFENNTTQSFALRSFVLAR
jgi:hypothetical protein